MARTVLITGCSDGGLGAGLAIQFHKRGDRVFATARNPAKMASLTALGIETFKLDVLSDESIKACVEEVSALTGGKLNMLVNNAGAGYSMPVVRSSPTFPRFDLLVLPPPLADRFRVSRTDGHIPGRDGKVVPTQRPLGHPHGAALFPLAARGRARRRHRQPDLVRQRGDRAVPGRVRVVQGGHRQPHRVPEAGDDAVPRQGRRPEDGGGQDALLRQRGAAVRQRVAPDQSLSGPEGQGGGRHERGHGGRRVPGPRQVGQERGRRPLAKQAGRADLEGRRCHLGLAVQSPPRGRL